MIKSTDLQPGDVIRPRKRPGVDRIVHSRKAIPDDGRTEGWWLAYLDSPGEVCGGIADFVFDERWELVERAEDHVWVPISLLKRLRERHGTSMIGVGADVPLIEALIGYIPSDPRMDKIEKVARAMYEAAAKADGHKVEWRNLSTGTLEFYLRMGEIAVAQLEEA